MKTNSIFNPGKVFNFVVPAQAGIHLVLALALVVVMGVAQVGFGQVGVEWERTYGDNSDDWCNSILQLADGGYALAGYTASMGAGSVDMWFIRTNSIGETIWSNTFGGENQDFCFSIIQLRDGGFALAGGTSSFGAGNRDYWLVRTDEDGDSLWSQTYGGGNNEVCQSLIQTEDGGFALAGYTLSFGAGAIDFWLVRTDENGDSLWSYTYGGESSDMCMSLVQTTDGGFAMAGSTESFGNGRNDFWLVRTDENGENSWSRSFGGPSYDPCFQLCQTENGGFALAGTTRSFGEEFGDFWLVCTNENGDSLWSRSFGGGAPEYCRSIIQTPDQGFLLAGHTESFDENNVNFWAVRTDSRGDSLWSRTFGEVTDEQCYSSICTEDGGYAFGGIKRDGNTDFYIIKTTPDPVIAHRVSLRQGWNLLSSVCPPANPAMPAVWEEIVSRGNLILTKNQSGQYYNPNIGENGFNNMSPFDVRQGYMAKLAQADTLVIVNVPVAVETPIPLRQGWNIAAYFPEEPMDVRDAFASVQDELLMVKDTNGRFYRAQVGYSNMQPLRRGQGYQVAMSQAAELVYNIPEQQARSASPIVLAEPVHFLPLITNQNMSIIVSHSGILSGELGCFNIAGRLIGGVALEQCEMSGMAIWSDDPTTETIDGAIEGERLSFRFWNGETELNVDVTWIEGEESYQADGFGQIRIEGLVATTPTEFALAEPYPNPFNSITTIRYSLPEASNTKLTIFDLTGREIAVLATGNKLAGVHNVLWNAEGVGSGLYVVRMETGTKILTRKVMLVK